VPISISNAERISTLTLTLSFNPAVLRVRSLQEGTFMKQGGVAASYTPRIDLAAGRVDIVFTRPNDQIGASGPGLVAAALFDAIGAGAATINVSAVAQGPDGKPVPLQTSPATVTVR
jgi:hypothetical protein